MEQIAAKLADVLEHRAVPTDNIVPELAGRELFPDHDRAAADQNCAGRKHAADAVIHRQAVIHPVRRLRIHHAGKPVAPLHDAGMADVGGLGQACGAGGIDVERAIFDGGRPPLVSAQRFARFLLDLEINAPTQIVQCLFVAVNPDRGLLPRGAAALTRTARRTPRRR